MIRHPHKEEQRRILPPEAFDLLIERFGGVDIWISAKPTPHLCNKLGPGLSQYAPILCESFGDRYLRVPLYARDVDSDAANRREKVAELHRQGMRVGEIVQVVGCNRRTIFRDLKRPISR